jgi:cell division protein ZapA (FtsZ GTPase activity inhibitor)
MAKFESSTNTYKVKIYQQELSIKTDGSPDYVREIVQYVDAQIALAAKNNSPGSSVKTVILAALNIAEELFQKKRELELFEEKLAQKSKSIMQQLEQ